MRGTVPRVSKETNNNGVRGNEYKNIQSQEPRLHGYKLYPSISDLSAREQNPQFGTCIPKDHVHSHFCSIFLRNNYAVSHATA